MGNAVGVIASILGFLLILLGFVAGCAAIVGTGVGLVAAPFGVLSALLTFKIRPLRFGFGILAAGIGGVIVFGLTLRFANLLFRAGC